MIKLRILTFLGTDIVDSRALFSFASCGKAKTVSLSIFGASFRAAGSLVEESLVLDIKYDGLEIKIRFIVQ